jgi:hypothetical protein
MTTKIDWQTHKCPVGPVRYGVRRGSVVIEPHPGEDWAYAAMVGAPCTCGTLKERLIVEQDRAGRPRLKPTSGAADFPFEKLRPKGKSDRRRYVQCELARMTMPALVRYVVPVAGTMDWVRSVRRRGLANAFGRPELGEGVAYVASVGGAKKDGKYRFLRAMVVACINHEGKVGARIEFVETGGFLNPTESKPYEPDPIDIVKARMSLPQPESFVQYFRAEKQSPTPTVW